MWSLIEVWVSCFFFLGCDFYIRIGFCNENDLMVSWERTENVTLALSNTYHFAFNHSGWQLCTQLLFMKIKENHWTNCYAILQQRKNESETLARSEICSLKSMRFFQNSRRFLMMNEKPDETKWKMDRIKDH